MNTFRPCSFCGREVEVGRPLTYEKVVGWEHPRLGGGTNALALREPQGVFACSLCIERMRAGVSPSQGSLL